MVDSDGQMQLKLVEHSYGAEGDSFDESMYRCFVMQTQLIVQGKFSAAVASLTLAFCRGCGSDVNTDDILLTVMRQLTPGMLAA